MWKEEPYEKEYIEKEKLKRYLDCEISFGGIDNKILVFDKIDNAPTVPVIPIERIKKLREEIERSKPNNPNFQWYKGETIQANKDLALIDNMMKEYEE